MNTATPKAYLDLRPATYDEVVFRISREETLSIDDVTVESPGGSPQKIKVKSSGIESVYIYTRAGGDYVAGDWAFQKNLFDFANIILGNSKQVGGGDGVFCMNNCSTNPSSNPTNAIILYASGGELLVRDSSGNVTTLSPHAKEWPTDLKVSEKYPAVCVEENDLLGLKRWTARGKIDELVQELARGAGLLGPSECVVKYGVPINNTVTIAEVEAQSKESWKKAWIESHKTQQEISKEEATEGYDVEIADLSKEKESYTEYDMNQETCDVIPVEKLRYPKKTVKKIRLKKGADFDTIKGTFNKECEPSSTEAETAAQINTDEWKVPKWITDRVQNPIVK